MRSEFRSKKAAASASRTGVLWGVWRVARPCGRVCRERGNLEISPAPGAPHPPQTCLAFSNPCADSGQRNSPRGTPIPAMALQAPCRNSQKHKSFSKLHFTGMSDRINFPRMLHHSRGMPPHKPCGQPLRSSLTPSMHFPALFRLSCAPDLCYCPNVSAHLIKVLEIIKAVKGLTALPKNFTWIIHALNIARGHSPAAWRPP